MGKDKKVLILSIAALVILIALFWSFWDSGHNWYTHSYRESDEEPYGADLTFEYIKGLREEDSLTRLDSTIGKNLKPFLDDEVTGHNYLVYGYLPFLDSLSKDHLFRFVEQGNSVFLLTGGVNVDLLSEWHQGECILYDSEPEYDWMYDVEQEDSDNVYVDSLIRVNFTHADLRFEEDLQFGHYVKDELKRFRWPFLDSIYFCDDNESLTALGTINEAVNYFRVPIGDGFFYVHTNPKLLTNFYLVRPEGRDYADRVFAHLASGPILWDNKRWDSQLDQNYYSERYAQNEGPLTYLLSQESLRWMLVLLFIMTLLLFVFGSRRKQRAIPVLRPKENSSLEYVDTISQLYYTQAGDGRIFRYLSEQFQFYSRKKYRINFKWKEEETWGLLSKASGIPSSHIQKITTLHSRGSYEPNVDNEMLVEYYRLMDHFYSNCK